MSEREYTEKMRKIKVIDGLLYSLEVELMGMPMDDVAVILNSFGGIEANFPYIYILSKNILCLKDKEG